MFDVLVPMLFGWPAIILSLGCSIAGLWVRKPALLATGAALFLLPAWYLSHYSMVFASLPLFLLASAYSVSKNKTIQALLLFSPVLISTGWLGFIVLTQ